MAKEENKAILTLDGVEYDINKMEPQQKAICNHIADLDRKINSATFNLEQMQFGREAFMNQIKASLTKKEDKENAD